jgi:hypothetical protein
MCAALLMSPGRFDAATTRQQRADTPKSLVVLAVGCAKPGIQPNIWILSHVAERSEASRPGITTEEKERLPLRPLGENTYELIGVADFVDADTSRTIGVRGEILPRSRVNATGMLSNGHRVGVKGLFIQGPPPRINLTSVVDLAPQCP